MSVVTSKKSTEKSVTKLSFSLKVGLDDDRPVYLSGNFNNWDLKDEQFRLTKKGENTYTFEWPERISIPAKIEYKYLKGGWESVEIDRYGNRIENRVLESPKGEICDFVPRWRIQGLAYNPNFLPIIEVIKDDYEIPQLGKRRRICVLLPHDYEESDKHYPVLYMNDGQNLFGDRAPFGIWGVDEKMAILAENGFKDLILVTIDHGEKDRIAEYSPYFSWRFGRGDGKKYLQFVTETLKPYIDSHYRTKPERMTTGIGGSSMGGLISLYAGLRFAQYFGKLLVFSPSLWLTHKIFIKAINAGRELMMDIFLYAGGSESATMLAHVDKLKATLKRHPEIDIRVSIDPIGQHNEFKWGQEFPKAVEWLFFNKEKANGN
ncbi:MAG: alpha/beta hydrolase-fold protein [Cyclobacteriaceae bacterium]